MKLPMLSELSGNRRQIISFGGINRTDSYQEGEMTDCKNLSSERFPALYPLKKDVSIWKAEGLSDIIWHKKGYLSIINNKVSFTRYAETEKMKLCEEGWRPCFNFASKSSGTEFVRYEITDDVSEDITKLGRLDNTIAIYADGAYTEYEFASIAFDSPNYYIQFEGDNIPSIDWEKNDNMFYRQCKEEDTLHVYDGQSSRTVLIAEPLTDEEIEKLRDKKLIFISESKEDYNSEVYVTEGHTEHGITHLTLDREIYGGGTLKLYEANPLSNDFTEREEPLKELPDAVFSEKEYALYRETYKGELSEGKKRIEKSGDYICIFPDKIMYNLNTLCFEEMEEKIICEKVPGNAAEFEFGTDYFIYNYNNMDFEKTGLSVGDAVTFSYQGLKSGFNDEILLNNCKTAIIKGIAHNKLSFNSNTFEVYNCTGERLDIVIRREVPELEYVCSKNGRLYGVEKNKILVSKYNSPQNFQFFQGGASDSYYIEVNSPGEFTGAIPYSSYILFFKEKEIIKLYGEMPSEYQIVSTAANGVLKGSERSLAEINGVIYYLGIDGVYAYSGSYPFKISRKLADEGLSDGAAARKGSLYILTARTKSGEYKTYTYDTENGIWLMEDRGEITKYLAFNGKNAYLKGDELYLLSEGERGEFFAELCPINENAFNKKKYQRFYIRAEVSQGARLIVEVSFDKGPYQEIKRIFPMKKQVINIPVFPNRSDTVKIRLSGKGDVKVLSIMREFVGGSEK